LPVASAAIFLFPNLFVYDSNVSGNADHILAFWAAPLALTLIRMGSEFTRREAIVGAMMISAAALTKYQGCYLVVPSLLICFAFAIRQRRLIPLLTLLGVAGVITSSHWLKNLVFYHDPLYPLLNQYFPSTPFHTDAAKELVAVYWDPRWLVVGSWSTKLMDAAKALVTFSFVPNDFDWHGQRPTFGSLFTLLIPVTLLLKAPLRVWLLMLGTHLGLAIWYLTSHQDRFLQALVPWMATYVAVVLALVWRRGRLPRAAAAVMVLSQLVSGLDVYFIRTHVMLGDSVIRELSLLLASGHEGKYQQRYSVVDPTFEQTARALNAETVLLQHNYQARLGLGVRVVSDGPGWQGAIEYLDHDSPQSTAQLMRGFGVNEVFRRGEHGGMSPTDAAREIVLLRWLQSYGKRERRIEEARLTTIVTEPVRADLAQEPTRIAWLDCNEQASRGLYTPRGLAQGHPIERFSADQGQANTNLVHRATALVLNQQCADYHEWVAGVNTMFVQSSLTAGPLSLWVRTAKQ
ncbi:MAG TPA: hypothetical protein VKP30_28400, partial [Polyangiaceae bacterium]|nr:hypothetical protein [Polyangiaceae bacterium]